MKVKELLLLNDWKYLVNTSKVRLSNTNLATRTVPNSVENKTSKVSKFVKKNGYITKINKITNLLIWIITNQEFRN